MPAQDDSHDSRRKLVCAAFFGCTALADLTPLANWDTSSMTDAQHGMSTAPCRLAVFATVYAFVCFIVCLKCG